MSLRIYIYDVKTSEDTDMFFLTYVDVFTGEVVTFERSL